MQKYSLERGLPSGQSIVVATTNNVYKLIIGDSDFKERLTKWYGSLAHLDCACLPDLSVEGVSVEGDTKEGTNISAVFMKFDRVIFSLQREEV